MIARVTDADGLSINIHRTFLTEDGEKASVEAPRRLMPGSVPKGSAVRLGGGLGTLGVAEGIETALSAAALFSVPVWACLSATLLMSWSPPIGVRRVIICGDNDQGYAGQAAAYALGHRLMGQEFEVEVRIPGHETTGQDWNDIFTGPEL
jgi:putative DNA primase/helicase